MFRASPECNAFLDQFQVSANDCHHPRPRQVIVQPSAPVVGLSMGSATIRDSLIAQAAIDCWPEASWAITVFRTANPRPSSAASSSWARLSVSCPDALPQGLRKGIPA